jgi:hypothetical protein
MTADQISAIADSATAIAALTGVGIALYGLNTWRHQLIGQNEYRLAVRILTTTYEFESAIQELRHLGRRPDDVDSLAEVGRTGALFSKVFRIGRAFWQDEFYELKRPIHHCWAEFECARAEWVDMQSGAHEYDSDQRTRITQLVFNTGPANEWNQKWKAAVKGVEDYLRPYIKR